MTRGGDKGMQTRSPSETLMAAMTEFGVVEPKECIIVWIDEGGCF